MSTADAIFEACMLRFRPILMTTMAALFGALPLAFGTGTGSELRRPLGITIVGGLIVSQALTLYTTPVIYLYMDRLRLRVMGKDSRHARRTNGRSNVVSNRDVEGRLARIASVSRRNEAGRILMKNVAMMKRAGDVQRGAIAGADCVSLESGERRCSVAR